MSESRGVSQKVCANDGVSSSYEILDVPNSKRGVFILLPAMGVPSRFYRPFAKTLNVQGYSVVMTDLRGVGSSSVRASRHQNFGYEEMISLDIPTLIKEVKQDYTDQPIFLIGHSLGGQLSCLHQSCCQQSERVDAIILIGAPSVYYKGWSFPFNFGALVFTHSSWILSKVMGYFPGNRLGFGGRQSERVIADWANFSRTGQFNLSKSERDYDLALSKLDINILCLSFADDHYAPQKTVNNLINKMPGAAICHDHLTSRQLGSTSVDHFNWIHRGEVLSVIISSWLGGALNLIDV